MRWRALLAIVLGLPGCARGGTPVDAEPRVVKPACPSPAPLNGRFDARAPDAYIVTYRAGTDAAAVTEGLQRKYGFTARHVYTAALLGFAATLTPEALAGIRCEPEVEAAEYEGVVTVQ